MTKALKDAGLVIAMGRWHQMQVPEEYKHLPRIAIKRDPIDWYPSWFGMMRNYWPMDYFLPFMSNERGDLNEFVRDCYLNTRDIKSPVPYLHLANNKGPWTGYKLLANADLWIDFDDLENGVKEIFGDIPLPQRNNALKEKQTLSQSSKIFIEAMES